MGDSKLSNAQAFHDYGLYLPTKTLEIFGEVNTENCAKWIKNIHILDSFTGLISIKLNSEGGDTNACAAVYDAIINCKNDVRIIVYGSASSSASIILQAGDERIMSQNSYLMIHVGEEGGAADHPRNKERWDNYYRKVEAWMEDVYLKRIKQVKPRFTRRQIKEMMVFDSIFDPKQALELGLIDNIGDPQ